MNRKEILDKLHNINIGANVIAQTFDMGLHYAYVTPKGYGESLGTMGEWPVLCFKNVTPDFLLILKTKIGNQSLVKNDLSGSDLLGFYESVLENSICHNELLEINKFFEELLKVNVLENNRLYVICDTLQSELKIRFFGSYKDLEQAFPHLVTV